MTASNCPAKKKTLEQIYEYIERLVTIEEFTVDNRSYSVRLIHVENWLISFFKYDPTHKSSKMYDSEFVGSIH